MHDRHTLAQKQIIQNMNFLPAPHRKSDLWLMNPKQAVGWVPLDNSAAYGPAFGAELAPMP
jgi:hypothetical protein